MAWLGEAIDWYHDNGLIPGLWKGITGQQSQEKIANENLTYQKERNAIEDARYAEETSYNRAFAENERDYQRETAENERSYQRAFAEDERAYQRQWAEEQRDYNRALQQQIFEREDTAISRQANELTKLGINPLSANMNGLGAGSVVSSTPSGNSPSVSGVSSPSSSIPNSSSRGGQALHNNMQVVDSLLPLVQLAGDIQDSIDGVMSGKVQRDSLRLQNDRQYLENLVFARKNGISYHDDKYHKNVSIDGTLGLPFDESFGSDIFKDADSVREFKQKIKSGKFDSDSDLIKTIKDFSTQDYLSMAEKLVTNLENIYNKLNIFSNKK